MDGFQISSEVGPTGFLMDLDERCEIKENAAKTVNKGNYKGKLAMDDIGKIMGRTGFRG